MGFVEKKRNTDRQLSCATFFILVGCAAHADGSGVLGLLGQRLTSDAV